MIPDPSFLTVRDLYVQFKTEDGVVKAVDGLSFGLDRGRTLGIVGESGSGKSVTSMAVMGLHDPRYSEVSGEVWLDGENLLTATPRRMEALRGRKVAMIFQDSLSSLSPFHTVGGQIGEVLAKHTGASRREARERAIEMLARVGIPQPKLRVDAYPHEFSGGMRQRAMIAMALVCDPELVIADEPTTALDVTVQAQILDLLKALQEETGSAIIMITHDLGVIADIADDVMVMYAGRAIERGTRREVLKTPGHPYTWGLLASMPHLATDPDSPLRPVRGTPPSLLTLPSGCPFHPRCDFADRVPVDLCRTERPDLHPRSGHSSACYLSQTVKDRIRG
ncbi:ABC transporter ATP-binding protein [Nonomuraea sp. NPDC050663]|uniref:ABC transporter ATP-binding protein n=1 Tax=Nonomuraea sp. NPDC050663 TaxID=3364370 RepID=UPI0037BBF771